MDPFPVNTSLVYADAANFSAVTVPSPGVTVVPTGEVPWTNIWAWLTGADVNVNDEPVIVKCVPGYWITPSTNTNTSFWPAYPAVNVNVVVVPSPVNDSLDDWPTPTAAPNSRAVPPAFTCTTLPPWPVKVLGVSAKSTKFPAEAAKLKLPEPSVVRTCPAEPSVVGKTRVVVEPESVFTSSPCLTRNFLFVAMFPLFHCPQTGYTFIYIFLTLDNHNDVAFVQLNVQGL